MSGERSSTASQALVLACERLVAERGFHGVTAAEVVRAAGQRNNSAIAYHFGSWEGLLDAVWAYHAGPISQQRSALLAEAGRGKSADLADLVSAYVLPVVSDLERHEPSHWARFNEQWLAIAPLDVFTKAPDESAADHNPRLDEVTVLADLFRRIISHLRHLAAKDRQRRVALMARFVISALAAWERDEQQGGSTLPLQELAAELVGLAVALLEAP